MSKINIFFYSEHCESCNYLMKLMQEEGILSKFKLVSREKHKELFPKDIKRLPTLFVTDVKQPLVAADAFKWLQSIKFMRQQQTSERNQKILLMNNQKLLQNSPTPIVTSEMTGLSDTYAYTEIDNPQPKTYFGYGEEQQNAIYTAEEIRTKLDNKEVASKISMIKQDRDQQSEKFKDIMKEGQLKEIMKHDKYNNRR